MSNVEELAKRVTSIERETRADWKEIIRRLSNIEAEIRLLGNTNHVNQSRQQDRWAGGLWLAAWGVGTAVLVAGVVVALLGYLR